MITLETQKIVRKILSKSVTNKLDFSNPYTTYYLYKQVFKLYKIYHEDHTFDALLGSIADQVDYILDTLKMFIKDKNLTEFDNDKCLKYTGLNMRQLVIYLQKQPLTLEEQSLYNILKERKQQ